MIKARNKYITPQHKDCSLHSIPDNKHIISVILQEVSGLNL